MNRHNEKKKYSLGKNSSKHFHHNSSHYHYSHSPYNDSEEKFRIITKNLVYMIGISDSISDISILSKYEYLGQYGKIIKIVINKKKAYNINNKFGPSFSAYITYSKPEEASIAILSLDNHYVDKHLIRASFGTTKYCQFYLKGMECTNKDCVYLHKKARPEDIINRDELNSNKNLFIAQQQYAIKLANIYNVNVKKTLMEFKNKNYNSVFPSPDTIYNNQIVIDNDPKRIKNNNNNNNNSYNYGLKRKNIYINKSKSKDKYRKSSKSIGNKINTNNNIINNNNNNNNNNNIINIQTQSNQKLNKIPIPKKALITNNNNNIINSNNNNNNNNNSNEKNNINCLKTIKPSDSDLNCTFTTTNTTFISKSNENILNISSDKIKLLFSRKEKSRFDFVENTNINKKRDEIIIPDFIRKITDKACNMIPLTKYYKNNNFINDIFLYKDELNECNSNNENWKKYFIKSYNDKKEMFLKNPSNKDILLKDFEKINNFVLKNNNKSA